jgi:hypothetical protein
VGALGIFFEAFFDPFHREICKKAAQSSSIHYSANT